MSDTYSLGLSHRFELLHHLTNSNENAVYTSREIVITKKIDIPMGLTYELFLL